MIKLVVFKDAESFKGFTCEGHAGYDEYGQDIVCAGVSALVINAVNSIDSFTLDEFSDEVDEETGKVSFEFINKPSEAASLLLSSMILGIESIADSVGSDYVQIFYKEV